MDAAHNAAKQGAEDENGTEAGLNGEERGFD
jgi:hypothetical protein